jgi:hypothetical protein
MSGGAVGVGGGEAGDTYARVPTCIHLHFGANSGALNLRHVKRAEAG